MAFLPDLCHLDDRLAEDEAGADGQGREADAAGGDIFGKVAILDLYAVTTHCLDVFVGKERDLPMPVAGVGITCDSVVNDKLKGCNRRLFFTLFG